MNKYRLAEISQLTPSVCLLTLEKVSGDDFSFAPGQYAALHFKRRGRRTPVRCLSIVSSPRQPDRLQFAAKIIGDFTSTLSKLEVGEEVYVQGPFGDFVVDFEHDRSLVMLAGGIGITPYISMLRYLAQIRSKLPVKLVYSYKDESEAAFLSDLEALANSNPYFELIKSRGRLQPETIEQIVKESDPRATYFLCGPRGFMDGVSRELKRLEVPDYQMVMEAFGQRGIGAAQTSEVNTRKVYKYSAAGIMLGFSILVAGNLLSSASVSAAIHKAESAVDSDENSSANSTDDSTSTNGLSNTSDPGTAATPDTSSGSTNSTTPTTTQTYQTPMSRMS